MMIKINIGKFCWTMTAGADVPTPGITPITAVMARMASNGINSWRGPNAVSGASALIVKASMVE